VRRVEAVSPGHISSGIDGIFDTVAPQGASFVKNCESAKYFQSYREHELLELSAELDVGGGNTSRRGSLGFDRELLESGDVDPLIPPANSGREIRSRSSAFVVVMENTLKRKIHIFDPRTVSIHGVG
jgi:hypothetical protein